MKTLLQISLCVVLLSVYSNGDNVPPSFRGKLVQSLQNSRLFWKLTGSHMKSVDPVSMKVNVVYTYDVTKISTNRFQTVNKNKDCAAILQKNPGRKGRDGVYTIYPDGIQGKRVYCDMTTEGGGWTVLQRRQDGSTDFYRTWREYKHGFGDPSTNYWIGNDAIYQLTKKKDQVLRVWLQKFNGDEGYAQYTTFYVGNEGSKYKLTVSGYSGTAGDSLRGARFSTKDQENDRCSGGNCTTIYHGAWWYTWYGVSNLNGLYSRYRVFAYKYPVWYSFDGWYALQKTVMMIRH